MQKTLFVLTIALLPFLCMAQTNDSSSYVRESRMIGKINLFNFSNGVEIKLGKNLTTYQQLGFPLRPSISSTEGETDFDVSFRLVYKGEFRYYHNMQKRKENGKRVDGFFANYFALHHSMPVYHNSVGFYFDYYYTGLHYGLQRKIGESWYLDANIGAGAGHSSNRFQFDANMFVGIGYTFR